MNTAPVQDQQQVTSEARAYYEAKKQDRNFQMGGDSGFVNHHFGIGDFDRRVLEQPESNDAIGRELHRLEMNQIDALEERMGDISPGSKILDAGCGRGGTAFTLARRHEARVEAINVSSYQVECAQSLVGRHQLRGSVRFRVKDYYALDYPPGSFDHVITNETTLYARDLGRLVGGFREVLKKGGRYTLATWCINEDMDERGDLVDPITEHYKGRMHRRIDYLSALEEAGFESIDCQDRTADALPYWELRRHWALRSGIEQCFLEGHESRSILYLFISAVRPS